MKILVTGFAGFIGSNLCEYLLDREFEVVGVDNFNDYYSPKLKEYHIRDFKEHKNFTEIRIDLLEGEKVEEIFKKHKFDAVIHLAAWAGVTKSIEIPRVYVRNNVETTVILLEACKRYNVNNFIFASTSGIYGDAPVPHEESMSTDFALSPYPATKKACEVLLHSYAKNTDINVSILRIYNPIGKRLRPDLLLPKLIRSCLYDMPCPLYWETSDLDKIARDYTYTEHIFEAILHILKNPFKYEIFNMGNSHPVSLLEIIATVEKVIGIKPKTQLKEYRQGEMQVTYANIEKAGRMIGYKPTTTIEESMKIYYNWFNMQEDWYKKGEY